ncbi:MAG: hypothetical protein LBK61_13300, partial [Spirochaetaceae bacterium]|nr:hypothetical protein [Spirochaetaceae bacterium]
MYGTLPYNIVWDPPQARTAPAGGENPQGFHPFFKSFLRGASPRFWPRISGDGQNTVMRRLCFPFGRAMPPH